jgi:hypothetical protein
MSAPTPVFTGRFDERGGFVPDALEDWRRYRLTLAGQRVEVTATKAKVKRSTQANRYLWLVYGYIADASDEIPEDIHELMKARLLGKRKVRIRNRKTGQCTTRTVVRSTASLSSDDFYEYVERVRAFAADWLGLEIPNPAPGLLNRKKAA